MRFYLTVWDKKEKLDRRVSCIAQYKRDGSHLRTIRLKGLFGRYIEVLIVPKNKVGDMEGWSIEDMIKLYKDTPEHMVFMKGVSKQ